MKAIIVKSIEVEEREVPDGMPDIRQVNYDNYPFAVEAESAHAPITADETVFTRMRLMHPEEQVERNYYVKLDDRDLWRDLITVSDGFVESKISKEIKDYREHVDCVVIPQVERDSFHRGKEAELERIKSLRWYRRLLGLL